MGRKRRCCRAAGRSWSLELKPEDSSRKAQPVVTPREQVRCYQQGTAQDSSAPAALGSKDTHGCLLGLTSHQPSPEGPYSKALMGQADQAAGTECPAVSCPRPAASSSEVPPEPAVNRDQVQQPSGGDCEQQNLTRWLTPSLSPTPPILPLPSHLPAGSTDPTAQQGSESQNRRG